jgi:cytoskeleton protein RodZ
MLNDASAARAGDGYAWGDADSTPFGAFSDPEPGSIGDTLRQARMDLGLSLDAAAARTRIKRDFLEAIEAMDPRGLPSKAYTVGYLRCYAVCLGLDPAATVERFKAECECEQGRAQPTAPQRRREIRLPKGLIGAVLILGGVIGATSWYGVQVTKTGAYANAPDVAALAADAGPVVEAPADRRDPMAIWAGLPVAESAGAMVFEALAPVSLEVRDASGRILFAQELAAGQTYRAPDEPGLSVSASDAGAVNVRAGVTQIGALGERGQMIEHLPAAQFVVAALTARMDADAAN